MAGRVALIVEQTAKEQFLNPGKNQKTTDLIKSFKDYADFNEEIIATVFGTGKRTAPADARADVIFDSKSAQALLSNMSDNTDYTVVRSELEALRDRLKDIETNQEYQDIRNAYSDFENTLNKEILDIQRLIDENTSNPKYVIRRLNELTALKNTQTNFGPNILTGMEAKASESGYNKNTYDIVINREQLKEAKLEKKGGRKLSSRSISVVSEEKLNMPTRGTFVLPLGPQLKQDLPRETAKGLFDFLKRNSEQFKLALTGDATSDAFKALQNTPAMQLIRLKGNTVWFEYIVNITENGQSKRKSYNALIVDSWKQENIKPPKFDLKTLTIQMEYSDTFEKKIQKEVGDTIFKGTAEGMNRLFTDAALAGVFNTLDAFNALKSKYANKPIAEAKLAVSKSIPTNRLVFKGPYVARKTSGSAFQSRIGSIRSLLQETRVGAPSMGDFVTDDTITALTKREMLRRMPIGPIGGPPKSSRVLTYRTGRFVNSVQVIADMRSKAMQYYYDPNYWIHEATSRNPRNLIDSSINSVTRSLFGRRFNLVKANQSL